MVIIRDQAAREVATVIQDVEVELAAVMQDGTTLEAPSIVLTCREALVATKAIVAGAWAYLHQYLVQDLGQQPDLQLLLPLLLVKVAVPAGALEVYCGLLGLLLLVVKIEIPVGATAIFHGPLRLLCEIWIKSWSIDSKDSRDCNWASNVFSVLLNL